MSRLRILHILPSGSEADGVCRIGRLIGTNLAPDTFETTFLFLNGQADDSIRRELDQANAEYSVLDAVSSAHPRHFLSNGRAAAQVRKLVLKGNFDIVHGHNFFAGLYASECSRGLPVVQTIHGTDFLSRAGWVRRLLQERAIGRAKSVVGISRYITETLRQRYPRHQNKCVTIYDGIDTRQTVWNMPSEAVRCELGLGDDTPLIGTVGMLEQRKGHDSAIRALVEVKQHLPDTKLLLVGGEAWFEPATAGNLPRLARELGVGDDVILTGFRRDVPNLMHAMDVFVHPALDEGFGLVVCEAMNVGTPVVAFNVDGVAEIIEHGTSGLLVEKGNVPALAKQITRLLHDTELAGRLARGGQQRVGEHFAATRMATEYGRLYEELANG